MILCRLLGHKEECYTYAHAGEAIVAKMRCRRCKKEMRSEIITG